MSIGIPTRCQRVRSDPEGRRTWGFASEQDVFRPGRAVRRRLLSAAAGPIGPERAGQGTGSGHIRARLRMPVRRSQASRQGCRAGILSPQARAMRCSRPFLGAWASGRCLVPVREQRFQSGIPLPLGLIGVADFCGERGVGACSADDFTRCCASVAPRGRLGCP